MTGVSVNIWVGPYLMWGSFVLLCMLVFAGAVVIIALLTLGKWMGHKARVRQEQTKAYREAHQPDGQPYPPSARGLCDNCQKPFEKVYYLQSGRRLCPDCCRRVQQHPGRAAKPSDRRATEQEPL